MSTRKKSSIEGPFVPHRLAMKQSPAWRNRPVPLMRILERLEVEHMRHAGAANGKLYVSYGQFVEEGVSRKSIHQALQLGEQFGLLKVLPLTNAVRTGNIRPPQAYRLTYLPVDGKPPTDEWKNISDAQATALLARYRK